jgi:simple sugar transport system permease protein
VSAFTSIAASVLDFAPPLILAALGGVLAERAGVVNIGLEGMMRVGAFFATWAAFATGSLTLGLGAGLLAGAALAAVHAWLAVRWRADQVISGIALNLVALGLVTFLLETVFGTTGHAPAQALPDLPSFFGHGLLTWVALALPLGVSLWMRTTVGGLRLRAMGEQPRAAASLGLSVARVRTLAVLASGALAGLGGADLSLGILHRFDNKMPAGMGFMALAAVVFGKWTPLGALGASLFFALGNAAADTLKSSLGGTLATWHIDGILLAAPYLLTLGLLAGFVGRAVPPAADGAPYDPEARS